MKNFRQPPLPLLVPCVLAFLALGLLVVWISRGPGRLIAIRIPGTDHAPGSDLGTNANVVQTGRLIASDGKPSALPGAWPQFRGPGRDGVDRNAAGITRAWQPSEPRELWGIDVGEGYAGVAVLNGRVYLMDYDREKKQDALRCLSLDDGREIWRFAYTVPVKRNHGMSRTVPAVTDRGVVAIGPKCHVVCLDPLSGQLKWGADLVRQYGATVPPWYAGQCPLLENDTVILAPGGKSALLVALDGETGAVRWQTPNPHGWKMTHSSIMPVDFGGEHMYVYCANNGVVGVSAKTGAILWETKDWKISIATVPSPLVVGDGRIFFSGGYNAGSLMLQLMKQGGQFEAHTQFRLPPEVFGATQHTPIVHDGHLYGVRPDNKFVCLGLDGKTVWASDAGQQFGLGPFLLADGVIFALNDSGLLRLIEATPKRYTLLAQAQVLKGRESWGPFALAGTRLLARDLTRLVCLEVGKR
jgi:outer membrane protein assembly factor BamB